MRTLHWYIFRELVKQFLLTVVATTALFTMAGGIYNVVRQEGVGGAEIFTLLPMLIPVFLPITTSISALFAVTSVFGRLSADNEFVACRAAGINIYRLFLAPIGLSLLVALLTTITWNFVVPERLAAIRAEIKSNLHGMAEERFQTRGYIRLGSQYFLTAQAINSRFDPDALLERGWDPDLAYFNIEKPAFLQLNEQGEVVRFVTADSGWIEFNTRVDPIEITAIVTNARDFSEGQIAHLEQHTIGPIARDLPRRENPSLLSLPDLLTVLNQPWKYRELERAFDQFKQLFLRRSVLIWAQQRFEQGQTIQLQRPDGVIVTIEASVLSDAQPKRLVLSDVTVQTSEPETTRPNRFSAPRGILEPMRTAGQKAALELQLEADESHRVTATRDDSPHFRRPRLQDDLTIAGLAIPKEIIDLADELDPAKVITTAEPLVLNDPATNEMRTGMQASSMDLRREVIAILHQRFGYAASPLVTTLMGAALGMIFRGSRALAAFGLAAIPFALATFLVMMGWQTAEKEGTELLGAIVIWGGLTAIGFGNLLLIGLGVRR